MTTYGANTTTDEILEGLDLSGRRYVITGAASGLGEEATRALTSRGASVTMLARDPQKNADAAERIRSDVPEADLELGTVDLASFESIRTFATAYLADHDTIDVLLNNAGVMACPQGRTADGFELQFGTNHLGHFLLTALLFPALMSSDSPRVVTLSSAAHATCDVDLDDIDFETSDYDPWEAYGRSKTANALFARGLAARYGDQGLISVSVHPGGIMTALGRHLTEELMEQMMTRSRERSAASGDADGGFEFKSLEAGAATEVWATVADLADHNGAYLADCQVGVEGGNPNSTGFMRYLVDDATADRLWSMSEELVGQRFPTVS
ncbi:MAG TPA: SDR family NAD(P)-dependent oxidoreductase [Acidimicrobiales bacterium]|nr:SDR family NAD(P)-dependent oxidoreductase [Acidimicrobiales bacterium]